MLRLISVVAFFLVMAGHPGHATTLNILAFGDSLTAGFGLAPDEAFPVRLEAALKARGHDVRVMNGGVSGDTSAAGRDRLAWTLTPEVGAVIVELGANDSLRGLQTDQTEAALTAIIDELKARNLPLLIAGMKAPRNLGPDYVARFDAIYPRLAERYDALLYPFFLDGVAADPALNQPDGIHPSAKGVDIIVARIVPKVEELIARAAKK